MGKRTDSVTIGAFVIGGLALVVAATLVWGSGRLFRQSAKLVCYFDDSVAGLENGAPVKARGVVVGKVVHIQLRYRQRPGDVRVPVFIELDVKRIRELGVAPPQSPEDLKKSIADGLRARLESQSIITGTLFVSLGFFPDSPVVLSEIDAAGGYPELPTVQTKLAEVGKSVTALLTGLKSIDLAGLVKSVESAASSIDRLASDPSLSKALSEAVVTLRSYERLADHLDASVPPLLAELKATTGDVRKTLVGLDDASSAAGRLVAPQSALSVRLDEGLADVSRAAKAVRDLADFLRRNPNALLVGKAR